jgi:hypothetical protein
MNSQLCVYFMYFVQKNEEKLKPILLFKTTFHGLHFFESRHTECRTAGEAQHNTHNCYQSVHTVYSDGQKVLIPLLLWNLPKRQRKLSGQVCQDFKSEPKPPVARIRWDEHRIGTPT